MLFSELNKFLVAFIAGGPWMTIPWAFAFADWVIEVVLLYTVGLVCKPCALTPIWIISILTLPIYVIGLLFRFFLETFVGLLFDGWLLFFNFSGCYMWIGRHCGRLNPGLTPTRFDIPVLNALVGSSQVDVKSTANIDAALDLLRSFRTSTLKGVPGFRAFSLAAELVMENADF